MRFAVSSISSSMNIRPIGTRSVAIDWAGENPLLEVLGREDIAQIYPVALIRIGSVARLHLQRLPSLVNGARMRS